MWLIFLADTELAAHLLGMNDLRLKADGRTRGLLLENFLVDALTRRRAGLLCSALDHAR